MFGRGVWSIAAAIALVSAGCGSGKSPAPSEVKGTVPEASQDETVAEPVVTATIEPKSGSSLTGTARFTEQDGQVTLTLEVEGAPPGELAVHLHQIGDCSAEDGTSAGPHWNPGAVDHGQWGHAPFHLGDIGNVQVGPDGYGSLTLTTDLWSIGTGEDNDILGRAIIIHEKADDFTTQPTGAAGGRIGCGVIE